MVKAEVKQIVKKQKASDILTRDQTIHMNKRLHGITFKNRAPRAIREIKSFATKSMGTRYVNNIKGQVSICRILDYTGYALET